MPELAWPPAGVDLRPSRSGRRTSTGKLPPIGTVQDVIDEAHRTFLASAEGEVSSVYPALARANGGHFGIAVASIDGELRSVGEASVPFAMMSVAKPFTFALSCELVGLERVRHLVGVDATGLPFNSAAAIEVGVRGCTNPMVNAGAIATVSLIPGRDLESRWDLLRTGLSAFAGEELRLDEQILASARASNHRNRALANLLASFGAIEGNPLEALELYTRQSCLMVTAESVARMGVALADGGINPATGIGVTNAETARAALAVMVTAGLYEGSGTWLLEVGLPGKSGIAGGILTVSPGKGAMGTYSPKLDAHGNSVRGKLAAAYVSSRLGMDILASKPARSDGPNGESSLKA